MLYDALHGTGVGVCDRALRRARRARSCCATDGSRRASAGTRPIRRRRGSRSSRRALRARRGARLGLATDGDADRYAVLDETGRALSETESLALLVDHLARSGRAKRGVAISIATGTLVEAVAREHGLAVERHPIGFKHLSRALAAGRADVAGEESGGFAWDPIARDKDGILACALFVGDAACDRRARRARGSRELERAPRAPRLRAGRARGATRGARAARRARARAAGARRRATRVRDVDLRDGVRLGFDDGFLMLRASGHRSGAAHLRRGARRGARSRARFAAGVRVCSASAA